MTIFTSQASTKLMLSDEKSVFGKGVVHPLLFVAANFILQIIMEWVEDIVEQSSSDSRYNLLTGFVAAAIIQAVFEKEGMKNLQYISDEYAIKVMEMLRLNSAQDEMQYSALDVVSKKVPDEIRYRIRHFLETCRVSNQISADIIIRRNMYISYCKSS